MRKGNRQKKHRFKAGKGTVSGIDKNLGRIASQGSLKILYYSFKPESVQKNTSLRNLCLKFSKEYRARGQGSKLKKDEHSVLFVAKTLDAQEFFIAITFFNLFRLIKVHKLSQCHCCIGRCWQ